MKHQFRIVVCERQKPYKRIEGIPPYYTGYVTVEEAIHLAKELWKRHGSREDWSTTLRVED